MSATDAAFTAIRETLSEIIANRGETPPEITLETSVRETVVLDSFEWAEFAIAIELKLGADPFDRMRERNADIHRVADIVALFDPA
ncbi:hypothetical protein [Magnetofaba australis]|uniref:Acyl carrier protein n=1 Tax=Magnetofaba australis IT-1 TaxID=1434232 RepID=A0A1Y2JZ54_9PROT|nr:hypothetical protein [Magnetofaba australis]OSM00178.1 hypothetical protein MAIT1_00629 [Magnetofaba australis IT-1]